jgi:hypothetical protein
MTDLKRPIAVDEPKSGATLVGIAYDRSSDVAAVTYDDGDQVLFPDCSRYEYGFCLVVEENIDGSFGTTFVNMDDRELDVHLLTALGRQEGLDTDEQIRDGFSRIRRMLDRSYLTVGIPGTFRRLRRFVLPDIHTLPADVLATLTPGSITREIISRLEVGDHAFSRSVMIRMAR